MHKALKLNLALFVVFLAGCTSMQGTLMSDESNTPNSVMSQQGVVGTSVNKTGQESNVNITMAGGGDIGLKSMNSDDKNKMSRALDAGTGKATHWVNGLTGIAYTVTPIRKVVIQDNPFCREYQVDVEKGDMKKQIHGTACVTTDGSWHTV